MKCPKCGSENVRIDVVTDVKTSHGSCLSWFFIILLSFLTFGLFLIIALLTNWRVYSKNRKVGICQNCGYVIKLNDDTNILMKKWWVWVLALIVFMIVVGAVTNKDQNKSSNNETEHIENKVIVKETNPQATQGQDVKGSFQELKEQGTQAINSDKLSEGINILTIALSMQKDEELQKILDGAYFERAEYFFSIKKYQLAKDDLNEIKNKEPKANLLYQKALANSVKPVLTDPLNGLKVNSKNYVLKWDNCEEVDYYQIQIEDKDWNTVIFTTTKTNSFSLTQYFIDLSVYYWHVRTHYPDYGYGNWSDKIWFALETPEGKIKKLGEKLNKLDKKYDEVRGVAFYYDPGVQYKTGSKSYLYIVINDENKKPYLRFTIKHIYSSDYSWLFIDTFLFNIDGEKYYIKPEYSEVKRDNDIYYMYEFYDCIPTEENMEMIKKIIKSTKTILRCSGEKYMDREITYTEKIGFENVLSTYQLSK